MATTNTTPEVIENGATLVDPSTGERRAVEQGSAAEKQAFGEGFELEKQAPEGTATFQTPEGGQVAAPTGGLEEQELLAEGAKPVVDKAEATPLEEDAAEAVEETEPALPEEEGEPAPPTPMEGAIEEVEGITQDDLVGQLKDLNDQRINQLSEISGEISDMRDKLDDRLEDEINDIERAFARRIKSQEQLNKSVLGGITTRGFRSGRARYAPEIQANIISAEERAALDRIQALENERDALISQAERAADDKDFELLQASLDAELRVIDEQRAQLLELNELAAAEEQRQIDLLKEAREQSRFDMEMQQMEFNMGRAMRQDELAEAQFAFNIEKGLADITGTFKGQPTFEAEQQALMNALAISGLTGEFNGAPTLEAKQQVIDNAFRQMGIDVDVSRLNETIRSNRVQEYLANARIEAGREPSMSERLAAQEIGQRILKTDDGYRLSSAFVDIPPTSRLAYVNNNPGNLRFANQFGASQGEGGFARFESPEAGFSALVNQVKLDQSRGLTLGEFISKYAPPSENDTELYISQIEPKVGLDRSGLLANADPYTIAAAMAQKESSTSVTGIQGADGFTGAVPLTNQQKLAAKNLAIDLFGSRQADAQTINQIESLMKQGNTVDGIRDTLAMTGFSTEFTGSIKDAAESISLDMTKDTADRFLNTLDRSIEDGNIGRVKDLLISQSINTLGTEEARSRRGDKRAVELMDEIAADLAAYENAGGSTDIFTGTDEKVREKLGTIADVRLAELANKVQLAVQSYRKAISGAAFTESESKEYKRIFPDIDKTSKLNTALINSAKEVLQGNVDFVIKEKIGEDAFNELFGEQTLLTQYQDDWESYLAQTEINQ